MVIIMMKTVMFVEYLQHASSNQLTGLQAESSIIFTTLHLASTVFYTLQMRKSRIQELNMLKVT